MPVCRSPSPPTLHRPQAARQQAAALKKAAFQRRLRSAVDAERTRAPNSGLSAEQEEGQKLRRSRAAICASMALFAVREDTRDEQARYSCFGKSHKRFCGAQS